MTGEIAIEELAARVGQEVGVSRWFQIGQDRIDAFADVTEDHQFIHVDPAAAAQTPFGTTIAHGFLSLSMLSAFAYDALPAIANRTMGVNYGFDRIRFLTPVPSNARLRARFTLRECEAKTATDWVTRYAVTVDIEGQSRPALVADWITMAKISPDPAAT
ncbi:MAG: nodulation protein NodN [Rhizobiales bacterium 65-9]|nr:MaoC family dehydratase [Hyphomicrobiales bacterium]OJY32909.1 MAG: nodulation protein NodN [Rhizobiales bacterium 65-9]